jgi:hypothetical protein
MRGVRTTIAEMLQNAQQEMYEEQILRYQRVQQRMQEFNRKMADTAQRINVINQDVSSGADRKQLESYAKWEEYMKNA